MLRFIYFIINLANSIPSEDGLNYDLNSPYPDTLFFKLNLNGTTEWITVLDVLNSKDPSRGFMLDTDIYGTLSANYHLFCVVKLLVSNGQLDKYNWYNYTTEAIQTTVYFTIVSICDKHKNKKCSKGYFNSDCVNLQYVYFYKEYHRFYYQLYQIKIINCILLNLLI